MKSTNIIGLAVIDLDSALALGQATDLVVDLAGARLIALTLTDKLTEQPAAVTVDGLKDIGEDAVTFTSSNSKLLDPDQLLTGPAVHKLSELINRYNVSSNDRQVSGKLVEVEFDPATWFINHYVLEETGLFTSLRTVPPTPDLIFKPITSNKFDHLVSLNDN